MCNKAQCGIEFAFRKRIYHGVRNKEMKQIPPLARGFCRGRGLSGYDLATRAILSFFIILLAGQAAAQPQATVSRYPQSVPLNRLLKITLEVVWAGEADVYDIPQPDLSALTDFEVIDRGLSATREGNDNKLRYDFVMKPHKQGEYDLAAMKVKYFEKGKDIPTIIPLSSTVVKVGPRELLSWRAKMGIGLGAALVACVIAISVMIRNRKRAQEDMLDAAKTAEHTRTSLLAELNAARSFRIEGATGEYLEQLSALAALDPLQGHIDKLAELRQLTEDVKFGGHIASPDQLNWAENLLKRAIHNTFPADEDEDEED